MNEKQLGERGQKMEVGALGTSTNVLRTQLGLHDSSGQDVDLPGIDFNHDGVIIDTDRNVEQFDRNRDGTIADEEVWDFFIINSRRLEITQVDPTIQVLIGDLRSADPQVVIQAVTIMGRIGLHNSQISTAAISAVISLLNSTSTEIRTAATAALRLCHRDAIRPHIAALEQLIGTAPIATAREAANVLILALTSADQLTLQRLVTFYQRDDNTDGLVLVYRLGGRELLRPALPYLVTRISRDGWIFDQTVPHILRDMLELNPTLAAQLIPVLLRQVADGLNTPEQGSERSRLTLRALIDAAQNTAARGVLLIALRNRNPGVRATAAYVLNSSGSLSSEESALVLQQLMQGRSIVNLIETLMESF